MPVEKDLQIEMSWTLFTTSSGCTSLKKSTSLMYAIRTCVAYNAPKSCMYICYVFEGKGLDLNAYVLLIWCNLRSKYISFVHCLYRCT